MDTVERARILAASTPDTGWFIADIDSETQNCTSVAAEIVSLCLANDLTLNVTGNDLQIFPDNTTCFYTFFCDPEFVESGALEDIDDVVSISRDDGVIVEAAPNWNKLWGLNRIDQASLPLAGTSFSTSHTGAGINIYVVDTGILATHEQLTGRSTYGGDFINEGNVADLNGHGTHVAGTAAGKDTGVAKNANVIGVKVLSSRGGGSTSSVVSGIKWAVQNQKTNHNNKAAVINMSLGGGANKMMNKAAAAAAAAGHIVVLAAGNDKSDACNYSPAGAGGKGRSGGVITVGATNYGDKLAWYSNWGTCVDILAPGSDITSSWIGSNTAYNKIDGTSMAAPHVAGVAATLLEKHGGDKTKAQQELLATVALNQIKPPLKNCPNELLQASQTAVVGPPTPQPTRPPTFEPPKLTVGAFELDEWKPSRFSLDATSEKTIRAPLAVTHDICGSVGVGKWKTREFDNKIVLVSRGGCKFYDKVKGLKDAGALAVIIYQDSTAMPFQPGPSSSAALPEIQIPSAMISKKDGLHLVKNMITKTATWGLSPEAGTFAPSMPPIVPNKDFSKYFEPNKLNGKACDMTRSNRLGRRRFYSSVEECAVACINKRNCKAINFNHAVNANANCALLHTCTNQVVSSKFVGYLYTKPGQTAQPTSASRSNFQRYFELNKDENFKCRTNKRRYYINRNLDVTLSECADLCIADVSCIFINYEPTNAKGRKCDLIKQCVKKGDFNRHSYKRIDSGANGVPQSEILFSNYMGTKNKINGSMACDMRNDTDVLEYELDLTREDCAIRCIESVECNYINYDSSARLPCTLLRSCDEVPVTELNSTSLESFKSFDSAAAALLLDESDEITDRLADGIIIGACSAVALAILVFFINYMIKSNNARGGGAKVSGTYSWVGGINFKP